MPQKKNLILEVSIESDELYRTDHYINAAHNSESHAFIIHNIHNPEWAARALKNVRNVKHVINMGLADIDESTMLNIIKVIYDSDRLDHSDTKSFQIFKHMIRTAVANSGINQRGHL